MAVEISADKITYDGVNIFDLIYPVGSIYVSKKDTDPGTLFGGTWARIKDKFLMAMGDTYTEAGGNASISLSTSNLPSHSHSYTPSGSVSVSSNPSFSGSTKTGTFGALSHPDSMQWNTGGFSAVRLDAMKNGGSGNAYAEYKFTWTYTPSGSISGGSYKFSGSSSSTNSTGSGTAFSIIPPYDVVYAWERTA